MFEMTTGMLLSGLVIGGVGFLLFVYGKRAREVGTLLAGIALSVLPVATHSVAYLWLMSLGVVAALFLIKRFGPEPTPVA